MSAQTGIEWCDSTFNPWMGCTKVSPACDHCYAERDTRRFGRVEWGAGKPRVRTSPGNWKLPERWNISGFAECIACGWRGNHSSLQYIGMVPGERTAQCPKCQDTAFIYKRARRRVFCASLADWLDNEVPIEWLVDLLDLIRRTPNLDWLLLTKRIGNWRLRLELASDFIWNGGLDGEPVDDSALRGWIDEWKRGKPPANVWVGSTVVDQPELDRDLLKLYRVPAIVRFLSVEPMLSALNLDFFPIFDQNRERLLHWVIAGGESGPHARPSHPDWYRSLRDQCAAAGVPFLFKQWGEWANAEAAGLNPDVDLKIRVLNADGTEPKEIGEDSTDWECLSRYGKRIAGRLLDGRTHDRFPAVQP